MKLLDSAQQKAYQALQERQFFKLICGGSLTEVSKIEALIYTYSQAGVDCIDVAPDLEVLAAVGRALDRLPEEVLRPLVMVSIPLDPDPHFRKIALQEPDCILCNACIPVCPTEAILPGAEMLSIEQPLCYGCGRCVEICPTEALQLFPFRVEAQVHAALQHPLVKAVEIHTSFADPYMLPEFLEEFQTELQDKLVAVCFRPTEAPIENWPSFLTVMQAACSFPLVLQIDGSPMSGSSDPEASLPALQAAQSILPIVHNQFSYITLSGGINDYTAGYLKQAPYQFIAGVGMGTYARQLIWHFLDSNPLLALQNATKLVQRFKAGSISSIMDFERGTQT